MAFYCRGRIEREIPLIRRVVDEVEFSRDHVAELNASATPHAREIADVIERALDASVRAEGDISKVFLLSGPDDAETEHLDQPIINDATDASGRTSAWVMMQRYASLPALQAARLTSELDDGR